MVLTVERHDEILRGISKKNKNVHFLKLNSDRFKDEWFLDNYHLTEIGEIEKAKQIGNFLLEVLYQ